MEPSPYSERFTIACNHSWEPAGEGSGFRVPTEGGSWFWVPAEGGSRFQVPGSGCCTFRRPAGVYFIWSMLRCYTNGGMAKDPGASL